jgi:hypothetical protein
LIRDVFNLQISEFRIDRQTQDPAAQRRSRTQKRRPRPLTIDVNLVQRLSIMHPGLDAAYGEIALQDIAGFNIDYELVI